MGVTFWCKSLRSVEHSEHQLKGPNKTLKTNLAQIYSLLGVKVDQAILKAKGWSTHVLPFILELAHGETIRVGKATVTNAGDRTKLVIDGFVPILKERDYIREQEVFTAIDQLYYTLQEAYLKGDLTVPERDLDRLIQPLKAQGSAGLPFEAIKQHVTQGELFRALKLVRRMREAGPLSSKRV